MIGFSELVGLLFIFPCSMLLHELMHIKSCGLFSSGSIHVDNFGLYADTEFDKFGICWYAGGVFTAIILFLTKIFTGNTPFSFALVSCGWLQLIYGILEGHFHFLSKHMRYILYITILLFMGLIW